MTFGKLAFGRSSSFHRWCVKHLAPVAALIALFAGGASKAEGKTILGYVEGPKRNDVVAKEILIDPPTLENLGVRWFVEGDSNRNASVKVSFRRKGSQTWRPALPLLRVHHEVVDLPTRKQWRAGNLFAGSVFGLEPGTAYEIRLEMKDPDGGAPPAKLLELCTRSEPKPFAAGRTLDVYPKDVEPADGGFAGLEKALEAAQPGDALLLHAGVYRGPFRVSRSGEPDKPIVLRGVQDGKTLLEGTDRGALVDVNSANHVMFEGLVFRTPGSGIIGGRKRDQGSVGIAVRRCRFETGGWNGIATGSVHSENWYVADNVLVGPETDWFPYRRGKGKSTGINVYGRGHVVCHNRVSRYGDGIAVYNFGPPPEDPRKHCGAIDFYGNDIFECWDDMIETDYGCHNVRVYRNRGRNVNSGLSVQPFYGGPVYLIRNEVYNVSSQTFKLNCIPAGIVAYNNTVCGARWGIFSSRYHNAHFRNNLFMAGYSMEKRNPDEAYNAQWPWAMIGGTLTAYTSFDHNGYGVTEKDYLIYWRGPEPPKSRGHYRTVAAFSERTGYERHGVQVDYGIFRKADRPRLGTNYTLTDYDLRLRDGSAAVDAGCVLPTITDGFQGEAPDLGCHELGAVQPAHGPRQ